MISKKLECAEAHTLDKSEPRLITPVAPISENGPVKAWEQPVEILTYVPAPPDPNPLFLEKRVYQGSSGRVYPLPVIDRIETEPVIQPWQAIHLENEYLRLMVLPQIGGRIHIGLDKLNRYDFFYRQNVIKPALVGLAGPWASGGVEFNWPQHHRPATYMPVEVEIERGADGSITVWCSDHDPMERMKGMHGLCLRPGKAYLELKVRLYNRTTDTRTFLWWANVATHASERYQSFFPRDVQFAADHAKRAITEFPLSKGRYYGVDYGERARNGVPEEEVPPRFQPDGSYPPNDLRWYANIPVPTSYMVMGSRGDFSGGYDHGLHAGVVAIANHHIAPGKKQWTWGNHEFGYAWDRNLTEFDGPYVELMVGAYTDNQPDFSFLAPGETKAFSHFWYPIREIGVPDFANIDAALRIEVSHGEVVIHLQVTSARPNSIVRIIDGSREIGQWMGDLTPEAPLHQTFRNSDTTEGLTLFLEQDGNLLLNYRKTQIDSVDAPAAAAEPPLPEVTVSNDELYLTGLHLEQYRHPTRSPESYWREAILRDPGDSRCNHAMGRWHLRRGEFTEAERYLNASIARLKTRNPNPYDGEPHYNLGLTLQYQECIVEAYEAFYKSAWNAAWRGPAYHRLSEIDCYRGEWSSALDHVDRSLRVDADNLNARNLKAIILRRLNRRQEAAAILRETCALDPLDIFSRFLTRNEVPADGQMLLDLAFDLLRSGLTEEALQVLSFPHKGEKDGVAPLLLYMKAHVLQKRGRHEEAAVIYKEAALADSDYVFPSRLEELLLLEEVIRVNPQDARAHYYLGNLLYDRRQHKAAIASWERAADLDPGFPTVWRNLGFGYFNVLHDRSRALGTFRRARELAPADARILYEYDQLLKRTGAPLDDRLALLQRQAALVQRRDDLSGEMASLLNSTGDSESALDLLVARRFQPWEGGEGLVLGQYVRARVLLAQRALQNSLPKNAIHHLEAAGNPPESLSEAKHLLMNMSMVDYWLGTAHLAAGSQRLGIHHLERAAHTRGDFHLMQVHDISETTFWSAMSLQRLGRDEESKALFWNIYNYGKRLEQQTPKIDYFATSLPTMLLFDEDMTERQTISAHFLQAQALIGLGAEHKNLGIDLLQAVLQLDRSHVGAIDLLRLFQR